ncbi:MAG: UDP-2,3-diacylglucosamine diphosphatase [Chlorobi bacterium]|nr:UDP-2,3-diacylglucosamine diphosphatase [Chlorobiota bacterium]MCI0716170.1 UDP-2,3-diacylglucosamine diphosphatase [Chlorobiota bacterium]
MSDKKNYFFSDVHLGLRTKEEEKEKERKLTGFLEAIRNDAGKIFIVGDLFDCWIEYRKVVPKGYYKTLAKLNEIVEQGVEVSFFSGNHDFWLNTYLRDDVGLKLHHDFLETEIDGKRFYILHGDGLSKGDIGYKIVKKILRNRLNQFLYSWLHPDIGIWLAQGSSRKSREHTEDKSHGGSGMKEFAEKKVSEGFDYVIMGHYHKPQNEELTITNRKGYYITLGDWIKNFTYGVFANGKFEIKKWS